MSFIPIISQGPGMKLGWTVGGPREVWDGLMRGTVPALSSQGHQWEAWVTLFDPVCVQWKSLLNPKGNKSSKLQCKSTKYKSTKNAKM